MKIRRWGEIGGLQDYKQASQVNAFKLDFRSYLIEIKIPGYIQPGRENSLDDHSRPFPVSNCNASVIERRLQASVLLTRLLARTASPSHMFHKRFHRPDKLHTFSVRPSPHATVCSTPCGSWDSQAEALFLEGR